MARALEDAYQAGKLRAIGVSNFQEHNLDNILRTSTVHPQVNQVLLHVGNTPAQLLAYCQDHDILVQANSPMGHGAILQNPQLLEISRRYGVTVAQLCLRYTIQLGTLPLPKASSPDTWPAMPSSTSPSPPRIWIPCAACRSASTASTRSSPSSAEDDRQTYPSSAPRASSAGARRV